MTYLFSISQHPDAVSINSLSIKIYNLQIDFKQYDYLIVTSKQVSKFLQQYPMKKFITKKALCVSKQSALSYKQIGGSILDIGSGYGDNLISKIKHYPKSTKWLYLRAKIVASNFVEVCQKDGYNIEEIIVYESSCSNEILNCHIENNANLIFTSPSSINCFLKNHTIKDTHKVIVIGKTTAKALPDAVKYTISKETTINSCIDEVIKF